ncbi:MAG: hypothetical protein IPM64_17050 [Phycisphaerales bacterium]|nr:hypothetical protein [Phycisphaerales bacterium]
MTETPQGDGDNGRARCEAIMRELRFPRTRGYGADYFTAQAFAILLEELTVHDPQTWEELFRLINERLGGPQSRSYGCLDLISAIGATRRGSLPKE